MDRLTQYLEARSRERWWDNDAANSDWYPTALEWRWWVRDRFPSS